LRSAAGRDRALVAAGHTVAAVENHIAAAAVENHIAAAADTVPVMDMIAGLDMPAAAGGIPAARALGELLDRIGLDFVPAPRHYCQHLDTTPYHQIHGDHPEDHLPMPQTEPPLGCHWRRTHYVPNYLDIAAGASLELVPLTQERQYKISHRRMI
jgi:hypothetical protein